MNQGKKDPYFFWRSLNAVLATLIVLITLLLFLGYRMMGVSVPSVFALGAVMNMISGLISFSREKKLRGNIYSVVAGVCLVCCLVSVIGYWW